MYAQNQASPSCPANTVKDSCGVDTSLSMSDVSQ